jgi:hypothetical protein
MEETKVAKAINDGGVMPQRLQGHYHLSHFLLFIYLE